MGVSHKETGFRRFRHWLQRTWLLYALSHLMIILIDWLPVSLSRRVGAVAGWFAYHFDRGHRVTCLENLKIAFPQMDDADARRLLKSCYVHLGITASDTCHFRSLSSEQLREHWIVPEPNAEENLKRAVAQNKGVIAISGHMGHWELVGIAYAAFGHPLLCVARRIEAPRIDALITWMRTRHGNRIIYQQGALRTFFFGLRKKKNIGIVMDQYAGRNSPFIEFFGKPASTPDTAARLHVLTGGPRRLNTKYVGGPGNYLWLFFTGY
jgi:KDO2-lipid IV(A) lauroyltransferase